MNTLKLYKNPKPYPFYSAALTEYKTITVTPVHQNLRSGYVDLQLSLDDLFSFNYLSYTRNGRTVYAWVTDVEKLGGALLYRVNFDIDPLRTYRSSLVLGKQFIVRRPEVNNALDPYLSSPQAYNDISINAVSIGNPAKRYAVVQKRREGAAVQHSRTPGHPSPYQFWVCGYDVNNWTASAPLVALLNQLAQSGQTSDVVTIYSIPYIDPSYIDPTTMTIRVGGKAINISGWSFIDQGTNPSGKFRNQVPLIFSTLYPDLTKTSHSVSLVIPDAGIIHVPDEVIYGTNPVLVREIDLFSGSCNYHLAVENGLKMTPYSVRGSALSTIPILSDPYDTYISQNQNNIAASIMGDVGSIVLGAGAAYMGQGAIGGSMILRGTKGLLNTKVQQEDAQNMIPTNPPAFLGSALVSSHNNTFYEVVIKKPFINEAAVRDRFGYPYNVLDDLSIPANGYIQTANCSVTSNGSVPIWAIEEINQLFDTGIKFS